MIDSLAPTATRRHTCPFVYSTRRGTLRAGALDRVFPDPGDAVDALHDGSVAAVVGALPFDTGRPCALAAPVDLVDHTSVRTGAPATGDRTLPPVTIGAAVPTEAEHRRRIAEALVRLRDPHDPLAKVVLARTLRLHAAHDVDADTLVARLIAGDPAGNGFSVDLSPAGDDWTGYHLVGASPEVLVRRSGDLVECHPLAGSARRHDDRQRDRAAAEALARSRKNRDEHRHVVESLRATLAPLCENLDVPDAPTLTSTSRLWHLGTPIRGRLGDRATTALELALAVHPTPAVCGTPTSVAAETVRSVEGDRGFYAGAVGWTDASGDGEWRVTIRCAVLHPDRRTMTASAGGGIVADSDPDDELDETTAKFGTVLDAWGVAR